MTLLSVADLFLLHNVALQTGGRPGIISPENLDLIAARVDAWVFDTERYPDVFSKAASYAEGFVTLHPFTDGNKRSGYLAAVVFLGQNGHVVRHALDAEQMMLDLVEHRIGVPEFADWLRANS